MITRSAKRDQVSAVAQTRRRAHITVKATKIAVAAARLDAMLEKLGIDTETRHKVADAQINYAFKLLEDHKTG